MTVLAAARRPVSVSESGFMTASDSGAAARRLRSLTRDLAGPVLEIGAGGGADPPRVPPGIRWIGLEPNPRRRRRLAAGGGRQGAVLAACAEQIPLAAGRVGSVLAIRVLCSVRDQQQVLAEIIRVLRPGGRFVFSEHVAAAAGTWRFRGQRAIAPWSRWLDSGCDPTRRTTAAIEAAGFAHVHIDWFETGRVLGDPVVVGYAERAARARNG